MVFGGVFFLRCVETGSQFHGGGLFFNSHMHVVLHIIFFYKYVYIYIHIIIIYDMMCYYDILCYYFSIL